ncbi:hypothetical protein GR925_27580 [Streptomyces sp. HUCO-GS316]|uniref:hypothetical protein n=1 Tax=Streptomyces sp. HUCO-GS316 TaxID=2692198 RepID=UPI0013681290|nr:hypothetical protein [Streptomyces sp. HUCO-GS316]MXM67088.1 hypothetical protein [Streptomyces sp. HUCO-GS316]
MPRHDPPSGQPRPEAEHVNDRIRDLMREPASRTRAARYADLLTAWIEATRDQGEEELAA